MSLSRPIMSALRFGYGVRPGEAYASGPDDLMAELDSGRNETLTFPIGGVDARWSQIGSYIARSHQVRQQARNDKEKRRLGLKLIRREIRAIYNKDFHARFLQAAKSRNSFNERLATFWFNHFSVSATKLTSMRLYVPLYEAEAIRPNMTGEFTSLVKAAVLHPAMLIYLDQIKSFGPNSEKSIDKGKGLNENLGRELLELHTLGVDGGYTQQDVRNAALVLTGMRLERDSGRTQFNRKAAEPGSFEVMGRSFGGAIRSQADVEAMLDHICSLPQTAHHVCRKLAIHFIADTPDEALVKSMTDAWKQSNGNLKIVYKAMLDHPAAWENPGMKARQPVDFIVAGLRAVKAPDSAFDPPKKKKLDAAMLAAGYPSDNTDDNADDSADAADEKADQAGDMTDGAMPSDSKTGTMSNDMQPNAKKPAMAMADSKTDQPKKQHMNPANKLTVGAARKMGHLLWEPSSPAGFEEAFDTWITANQLTDRIEWARRTARKYGGQEDPVQFLKLVLADAARDDTKLIASQAPSKEVGAALVLASPEFNRR